MIPQANITAWRAVVPWADDACAAMTMVREDLIEKLPGEPWRGTAASPSRFRKSKSRRGKP